MVKVAREEIYSRCIENCVRINHKLHVGRLSLDTRESFCAIRMVKPWNRFPQHARKPPSWEVFKFILCKL